MIDTCQSCRVIHPAVECHGMWYCPNPRCKGAGGAWFRNRLDSYKENGDGTHSVDEKEWAAKAKEYIKEKKLILKKAPKVIEKKKEPHKCGPSHWYQCNEDSEGKLSITVGREIAEARYCPFCGYKPGEK